MDTNFDVLLEVGDTSLQIFNIKLKENEQIIGVTGK